MKTLNKILSFSILFVTLLFAQNIFSQTTKTIIEQDEKIEKLLQEKRKNNSGITINDKFKIQIFFGNIENINGFYPENLGAYKFLQIDFKQ